MKIKRIFLLFCFLLAAVGVYSQNAKPDFRVVISTVSVSDENETKSKDSFKIGEPIKLKVEITNLSSKRINVPKGPGFSRPTLFRDGELVPYKEETRKRFETGVGIGVSGMLSPKPNETQTDILDLNEFYEPLKPGQYQLSLERRFFKVEDKSIRIPSNGVTFEISAKPDSRVVISTVTDSGEDETTPKDSFKVGEAVKIKVEITNFANEVIEVPEGIVYTSPTLFNDRELVSYHKEVRERFKKGQYITGSRNILPNQSRSEILDLNDYYEPLKPGKYQLSLERLFFKTDNVVSNTVLFEIVSCSK